MPLPFILAGVAIAAAGYGVKKGVDAKGDFNTADEYNTEAQVIYDEAVEELETQKVETQGKIETLGELKVDIYENQLLEFVESFEKIKNIDFDDTELSDELNNLHLTKAEFLSISKTVLSVNETLGGGLAALGAGGMAGFAAFGSVGMLATASTGTAIGTLSGAAATNATLAWLGGGALSAGGFGMAGGMAVLGGVVAGPVLAVGGMMLAAKAEEARHNAYANLQEAKLAVEQMSNATLLTKEIGDRFTEITEILVSLQEWFILFLDDLNEIIDDSTDYRRYTERQKQLVMMCFATAKVLKNLMETRILDEDGSLVFLDLELTDARDFDDEICEFYTDDDQ